MNMQIIDFEKKGNAVRFYLGVNGDQWGDDWDDAPYDCNAGTVYERFVDGYVDVFYPFDFLILEPSDGVWNTGYSKEDMMTRDVPCIVVVPDDKIDGWKEDFTTYVAMDGVTKIYFGDDYSKAIVNSQTFVKIQF